jgi:hypothetical protein
MPDPTPPGQQLDFEFLHSQAMMVMQEHALAEMYLYPDKDTPVSLAHRIKILRAIEAGDSESLGGEFGLQHCRERNLARDVEEEIIKEVCAALRNSSDTAFADRLLKALRMVNAGKVSHNISNDATAMVVLAVGEFRREQGRWPSPEEAQKLVESWREDGLRDKDGTSPGKLDPRTWRRVFAKFKAVFSRVV